MNDKTSPVPCCLFRWDETSAGTCRVVLPWSSKWSDVVSYLRFKGIDRLLAWGDSTGRGRCRFESTADGVLTADIGSKPLSNQALTLFAGVASPIAGGHSQRYVGEESFFSAGHKRFDFNACVDLRNEPDIRIIVHASAACGVVYLLTASPHSATGTTQRVETSGGATWV